MTTLQHAEPFADLGPTPECHFRLHLLSSIYGLLHFLSVMESRDASLVRRLRAESVITDHLGEAVGHVPEGLSWADGAAWWTEAIRRFEARAEAHLPLRAIEQRFALSRESMIAFALVGLVEEESRFGAVFAGLQTSTNARRPIVELVGKIARGGRYDLDPWSVCRPLLQRGLVQAQNGDVPRAERVLVVPETIWDAARGEATGRLAGGIDIPAHDAVGIGPELSAAIGRVPRLVADGRVTSIIIRGSRGSDREIVARAVAGALECATLMIERGDVGPIAPLATMLRAVPVHTCDLAPGETAEAPSPCTSPSIFILGPDGSMTGDIEPSVTISIEPLGPRERERHWRRALGDQVAGAELDRIVERFILPPVYIRRAAGIARANAGIDAREAVTCDDVRVACRSLGRRHLETHADRLESYGTWTDLVVTQGTRSRLTQLEQFCRHRERVLDKLTAAYGRPGNRGVRALFSGPSGTGKTFAARILASELGRDLYRLDLGATVSKYIGETEKNLHHIFSIAEELDVILLLDEGDSLLGGRTDVRSANDRYANLETNYLLQRLEHYQGVVLVTTNLGDNIDAAFERRMDVVAEFLPPSAEERLLIWRLHLAEQVDQAFLAQVATRCEFTGGQIRNAAKQAALLALDDNEPLGPAHIALAARIEYQKAGAVSPALDAARPRRRARSVESMLGQGRTS